MYRGLGLKTAVLYCSIEDINSLKTAHPKITVCVHITFITILN